MIKKGFAEPNMEIYERFPEEFAGSNFRMSPVTADKSFCASCRVMTRCGFIAFPVMECFVDEHSECRVNKERFSTTTGRSVLVFYVKRGIVSHKSSRL